MMDGHQTIDEAVYYAAEDARERYGNRDEAFSIVYELDGRFYYTPAHSKQRASGDGGATIKFPKGAKARFIVHNHPAGGGEAKFSQEDIETAEQHGLPSAIVFGRDAPQIRVFRPGVTATKSEVLSRKAYRVSDGDAFDWKPPPQQPTAAPVRGIAVVTPPQARTMPRGLRPNV